MQRFSDVDMSKMRKDVDLTGDPKIKKEVLHFGNGRFPRKYQQVTAHVTVQIVDRNVIIEDSRKYNKPNHYTIGKNEYRMLDYMLMCMRVGEVSTYTVHPDYAYGSKGKEGYCPPNATLLFLIEILSIDPKYRTRKEAIEAALQLKDMANADFKKQNWFGAKEKYHEAAGILTSYYGKDIDEIKKILNRNLSLVYFKTGEYKRSIDFAGCVLHKDEKDLKALVRIVTGYYEMKDITKARQNLDIGLKYYPKEQLFTDYLTKIAALEKSEKDKTTQIYKKMFST